MAHHSLQQGVQEVVKSNQQIRREVIPPLAIDRNLMAEVDKGTPVLSVQNSKIQVSVDRYDCAIARDMVSFPDTVFCIGAGDQGAPYLDKIPKDAYTIGCNSLCHWDRSLDWLVAFDARCCHFTYWTEENLNRHKHVLYSSSLVAELAKRHEYGLGTWWQPYGYFPFKPPLNAWSFDGSVVDTILITGVLRAAVSAGGCMLQLAAQQAGVKRIVMCGIDMHGIGHWDGFANPNYPSDYGNWPCVDTVQSLITWLKISRGIDVCTMSPTLLNVPRWQGEH